MAENVCGPSNALKSFSEHVDRDRSVHQDRSAGAARPGPSSFRSSPAGPSNEAEVRAFTAGAGPAFHAEPMQMPGDFGAQGPAAFQQMGPRPAPQRFASPMGHHPAAIGQAHVIGGGGGGGGAAAQWAAEFTATAGAGASVRSNPMGSVGSGFSPQQPPMQTVQRLQHFSTMGMMASAPPAFGLSSANMNAGSYLYQPLPASSSAAVSAPTATATTAGSAPSGVAGLTEAELEARFAQVEADEDFENEMGAWMAEYGPTAEERGEAAAQAEDVDAVLEQLADELDAQRLAEASNADPALAGHDFAEEIAAEDAAEAAAAAAAANSEQERQQAQDDLARTAGHIVDTLDRHPSRRFQESTFMRLMRRIQTREVTVQGDNLVDELTGQPLEVTVTANAANTANGQQTDQPQHEETA